MTHDPINTGLKFDFGKRDADGGVVFEDVYILESTNHNFCVAHQVTAGKKPGLKGLFTKPEKQFEIVYVNQESAYGKVTVNHLDGDLNGDQLVQEHMIITRAKDHYHVAVSFGYNDGEDGTMTEARSLDVAKSIGFDCVEPRKDPEIEENIYWAETSIPIPADKSEAKSKKK